MNLLCLATLTPNPKVRVSKVKKGDAPSDAVRVQHQSGPVFTGELSWKPAGGRGQWDDVSSGSSGRVEGAGFSQLDSDLF